jgi:DNA-binding HxlR family transcriptional regulator
MTMSHRGSHGLPLEVKALSIPELLRLIGSGATGSILLALAEGPLRTGDLATRAPGYGARTVYRYVRKIVEIGAIERDEEWGVPSKVIHRLTDPSGVELSELVDAFSQIALEALPTGGIVPHSWGSLTLLADLWESGMFAELDANPHTATELAGGHQGLSFHQITRRINLYLVSGMLREKDDGLKRRRYELTEEAREATALIGGLGAWRERHVVPKGEAGLTGTEVVGLLRAVLPLLVLPKHPGKCFELTVLPATSTDGDQKRAVWGEVGMDGAVVAMQGSPHYADGRERREVRHWIEVLLQGTVTLVGVSGGDDPLMTACLQGMHEALWTRE